MPKRSTNSFKPDYAVIPGKTVAETLASTGMTQMELAERTDLARKTIKGIINGSEPITPETAIQLKKYFACRPNSGSTFKTIMKKLLFALGVELLVSKSDELAK